MAHFIYEITEKRYKTLNYLAAFLWITVILALIGLFSGEAFLDDFHQYNFGQYPKSDLYLKSWALLGSFSFIIGIIFLWIYSRNFKEKVPEKRIVFLWYFSFLSFNYFKPP